MQKFSINTQRMELLVDILLKKGKKCSLSRRNKMWYCEMDFSGMH